jgi:hypothetical protein
MKKEKMQEQVLLQVDELEERIAPDALGVPGTSGSNSASHRNADTAGGNSQSAPAPNK